MYFPPTAEELAEWQLQLGIQKYPDYPVRGIRETYYRARQALCQPATSLHSYACNLDKFALDSYQCALDTEKQCGHTEYSGANMRGGQQMFWQGKNFGPDAGDDAPKKAFVHINYQMMIMLSDAGVQVLE